MSFDYNFKFNQSEYPLLFTMKKKDRDNYIKAIFKTGYLIHFPDLNTDSKTTTTEIREIIEQLKNELNGNDLNDKINSLEASLEKLIGLSHSSSKKGELAENILEEMLSSKYPEMEYINMAQIPHSGDAWLKFEDTKKIMLESKNYVNKVTKEEIDKMEKDMKTNNIQWGIFISWNSAIVNTKEFDIKLFNHHGNTYTILFLSNLSKDVDRIILAIQLLKNLIKNYSNLENFPWITSAIKQDLDELNSIIKLNYSLRDNYDILEKQIKSSLNSFYSQLRDYQFKIDSKIEQITQKIDNTSKISLTNKKYKNICNDILKTYNSNKNKPLIARLLDEILKNNLIINNQLELFKQTKKIGIIKIQTKKINVIVNKVSLEISSSEDISLFTKILT